MDFIESDKFSFSTLKEATDITPTFVILSADKFSFSTLKEAIDITPTFVILSADKLGFNGGENECNFLIEEFPSIYGYL